MAAVLRTNRLPDNFVGALSSRFRVTDADEGSLPTELRKGGVIHALLCRLMSVTVPGPGLAELTLLEVDQNRGVHILHFIFYVPAGPYNPGRILFGCCRDPTSEGLPFITKITVDSFGERRVVSAVSREDHQVHL